MICNQKQQNFVTYKEFHSTEWTTLYLQFSLDFGEKYLQINIKSPPEM